MKILIVDDEKFFRTIEIAALQRLECDILEASNGIEALEIITREIPDIVLMDVNMPEMSGEECCEIIKGNPETKDIPVIMVSAADTKEHRDRCYAAGCDDFVAKPLDQNILFRKIGRFIDLVARAALRISVDIEVNCIVNGKVYKGTMKNLSDSGALIECSSEQSVGENVQLNFVLPLNLTSIAVEGVFKRVVKNKENNSVQQMFEIGVEFVNIPAEKKQLIGEHINTALMYQF